MYHIIKLDPRGKKGYSFLHYAVDYKTKVDEYLFKDDLCSFPHFKTVELLIECGIIYINMSKYIAHILGIDPDLLDNFNNTPLQITAYDNSFPLGILVLLIINGAHRDYVNKDGNSLLKDSSFLKQTIKNRVIRTSEIIIEHHLSNDNLNYEDPSNDNTINNSDERSSDLNENNDMDIHSADELPSQSYTNFIHHESYRYNSDESNEDFEDYNIFRDQLGMTTDYGLSQNDEGLRFNGYYQNNVIYYSLTINGDYEINDSEEEDNLGELSRFSALNIDVADLYSLNKKLPTCATLFSQVYVNLSCLAARCIRRHYVPYKKCIPFNLEIFVDRHGP
ncbi:unnamed protein product [Gordionus sp. m RMFG-2023]